MLRAWEAAVHVFHRRSQPDTEPRDNGHAISASELKQRLERGEPTLALDVRQPTAYAEYPGAIPGSTRISPSEIPDRYPELPRDRLIVPYCT